MAERSDDHLEELIHRADLDGLIALIDRLCSIGDFAGLHRLRRRAHDATRTGRQLWPAATLAEYRIALLAPPAEAAAVLDDTAGRFTIGPLTEVIAQDHTWAELEPHLDRSPLACSIAHERAIRGEIIEHPERLVPALDIPAVIADWEPEYVVAEYHPDGVDVPTPPIPPPTETIDTVGGAERLDDDVEMAVRQLVEGWTTTSDGHAEIACVSGGPAEALGAFGIARARLAPISGAEALAWLAWAGASGGAHGRRRGAALGRFGAWWTLAALIDALDEWPPSPTMLGAELERLRWWWWDAGEPATGWNLTLVVADESDEPVAWAIHANDAA